ncbi:UDP-N-acetylmuramoyl-tripeptide--D-alanyl-D-alanine ligase [Patescibacteria group bacterium]|nr:UDP-N-acetylmuramoyl-tripeptide--D-alanyl-D-alanine ligase [Patescibacteria group bacterium]
MKKPVVFIDQLAGLNPERFGVISILQEKVFRKGVSGMVILAKKAFRFLRWKTAQAWLKLWPNVDVVGVAGSVGKTTVKEITATVLAQRFRTVRTKANLDPIFNLPITALRAFGSCKFVAELGIDGFGQMDEYLTLVQPRVGILTRLTLEHTDEEHFGSLEKAIAEEAKMLKALPSYGWAILNGDDDKIREVADITKAHKIFYGFGESNNLRVTSFEQRGINSKATSVFDIRLDTGLAKRFKTNFLGKQNVLSACAGICAGILMGMSFEDIQKGLLSVHPVSGRLEPKAGKWGLVIDDSYNASPAAVEAAIDVLVELDPNYGILVLGDMLELGKYARESHRKVGEYAKSKGVKFLIAYGEFAKDVLGGYGEGENSFAVKSHKEAVERIHGIGKGIVLVKGSRGMCMDKVVSALTG